MTNALKVVLVLGCVSIVWAVQKDEVAVPAEQQQAVEKAILKVHEAMKKAAESFDADALYDFVLDTDKGVIIEDGRLRRTRKEALDSTRQGLQGISNLSYTYNQKHITVISPTTALWVADGTSSATVEDGRTISVPFAETIVFVQRDGQWKVLHAHRSAPNPR